MHKPVSLARNLVAMSSQLEDFGSLRRLSALVRHLQHGGGSLSLASAPVASAPRGAPKLDIFIDFLNLDSYLSLPALFHTFEACQITWRCTSGKAKMTVPVGMMREHSDCNLKQRYQLQVNQTYAALRGAPLTLPKGSVDVSYLEQALAFVTREESPEVAKKFLQSAFLAIYGSKAPLCDTVITVEEVERILAAIGANVANWKTWVASSAPAACRSEDTAMAAEHGIWSTPASIDAETKELFMSEEAMGLLALRLRRRGYEGISDAALEPLPVAKVPASMPPPSPSRCKLEVWVDLKSPYAFMAIEPTYALEADFNVDLVWKPLLLDLEGFLGSAEVGAKNNQVKQGTDNRSKAQWVAVKYAYMNNRRFAAERDPPITLYGTQKIWDSTMSSLAMLFAIKQNKLKEYQQRVWPRFWRRELDIEKEEVLEEVLQSAGIDTSDFKAFVKGPGMDELLKLKEEATSLGVFGVPTYRLNGGDIFFGREHLPLMRYYLYLAGAAKREGPDVLKSPYLWRKNDFFAGF
mmetsp:Transcript_24808/g.53958  ORF Transcript_24808/g.53958 Transcript_24808/m.53958 type:complete len:522 (-) Transcript_24808:26-1591(-)